MVRRSAPVGVLLVSRTYVGSSEPPRTACSVCVASSFVVGFATSGRAVRAADPVLRCHGFSPWRLWPRCVVRRGVGGAWLSLGAPPSLPLTPRALRLEEPHRTSRPLTPYVAPAVLAREIHPSRSPLHVPTCVRSRSITTGTRLSYAAVGLGATAIRKPERLPSARCSILRSNEA